MLESYVTPLLMSYVDRYIKNLKPSDLQLSLWGGDVVLSKLDLKLDVLEQVSPQFGMPNYYFFYPGSPLQPPIDSGNGVPANPSFFTLWIHSEATKPIVLEDNTELNGSTADPQELKLPFTFLSGHIHELRIHVPWTKLGSEPVVITINTMECILKLKEGAQNSLVLPMPPMQFFK
ncbi:UNVERIFIED_CONTAM: hypothetical protein FKN15_073408 [Acipenser sinensis]